MKQFEIGVCSWSLKPEDPAELIENLRAVGLSVCQLALGPVLTRPEVWGGAVEALRDAGVRIASGMMAMAGEDYSTLESIRETGGVTPDETWDANRATAGALAKLASEAGIPLVTFHAGFIPHDANDPQRAVLLERIGALADIFAEHGVAIALETGQETAGTLLGALEALGRSEVGVNFDPANMILYGMGSPVDALETLAPHVRQIHIKDAVPTAFPGTWGTEVPVGKGAVDWKEFFAVVKQLPRPVRLIIEREAGPNRVADIVKAIDLARAHLTADAVS